MMIQDHISSAQEERRTCRGTVIYMGNIEFSGNSAAAHRVINNGKLLQELGYRVIFFGTAKTGFFEGVRQFPNDARVYEESYPADTLGWIKHTFSAENIHLLARRFSDLELIITYNIPYVTFKAVKRAFRRSRVKLAYDCTEWSNYTDGSLLKRLYKKIDLFELMHFLPGSCGNIIAVSSMIEDGCKRCNTLRLPPLVDTADAIWRQVREDRPGIYEFCYSAATFENKDSPDALILAFGMLEDPDVRLRVIGLDKDEALRNYPSVSGVIKSDDRISFAGKLSHEQTVRQLLSADCFVFFRTKNRRNDAGFPTKFVEAYTCSTPILTNNTGDLSDYADGRRVVVTDDMSAGHIKDLLMRAVSSRKKRPEYIDTTFDYHRYIDRTREWISRLY